MADTVLAQVTDNGQTVPVSELTVRASLPSYYWSILLKAGGKPLTLTLTLVATAFVDFRKAIDCVSHVFVTGVKKGIVHCQQ